MYVLRHEILGGKSYYGRIMLDTSLNKNILVWLYFEMKHILDYFGEHFEYVCMELLGSIVANMWLTHLY